MDKQIDFLRYEPLEEQRPYHLLDRHPSGDYLALVATGERARAAVWHSQTGKLAWVMEGCLMLAWLQRGSQLALLREPLNGERLPGQDENEHIFERYRWPDGTLISRCPITLPLGWPDNLLVSPQSNLVVVRWLDQGASGWEFVLLRETGDLHLREAGTELDSEVAVFTQPGFSPDGRYAVSGYHTQFNPAFPAWESAHWKIAQQGHYEVGCVTVIRLFDGTCYQIPIADAVPIKLRGTAARFFDPPVFLDNTHFFVLLPTGAKRTYQIQE